MAFRQLFFCSFLFLISNPIFSQDTRGLYVNNFKDIIGDSDEEDKLLNFVRDENFNYLLLYNLHHIHTHYFDMTNADESMPLANFIEKAKTMYGVEAIGGVGEKFASFEKMELYNLAHEDFPNRQLDVFNIEFEFWNNKLIEGYYCTTYLEKQGFECNQEGAFEFYLEQIDQLAALAESMDVKSESYIGKPTLEQCGYIGEKLDRVLVHYYKKKDTYNNGNSIYNYRRERLPALAPQEDILEVLPIFSAMPYHMGPWLASHPKEQAFDTWLHGQNGYEDEEGDWKEHIYIGGYQWYRYTNLYDALGYNSDSSDRRYLRENEVAITTKNKIDNNVFAIYPNPAARRVIIKSNQSLGQSNNTFPRIFDALGRLVWEGKSTDFIQLNVQDWKRGIYFVKIENETHKLILK